MKKFLILLFLTQLSYSQENFTRKDTLRGGLRIERTCYDITRYDINIKVNIEDKFISGYNQISFKTVTPTQKIQVDLFDNLVIDSIVWNNQALKYNREFNAVFIDFPKIVAENNNEKITFYYSGKPTIAKHAPWDGGFVFSKDKQGKPWVGVACQGFGASSWIPCKDSQTDEPDLGATIKVAVPNGLMNVSNGRLTGSEDLKNGYTRWDWEVKNPINSYDITLNIADYEHFGENYKGLDLDYYVLKENIEKAKIQFEQVKPMLDCFQEKFGEYPFKEDGYKLVETSYLGMEHQSAVAYGNKYKNGYLGSDLSRSGVGSKFDFIIIHESGHEWFGNSITSKDLADMWIHEGFTQYSEIVYAECTQGYEKAMLYAKGLRFNVKNDKPIIGHYGVNNEGSGDMYPKGALLLNTLRHVINNDVLWWKIIKDFATTYKHQIIDTETVVSFFNEKTGKNLTPIFNQYLRYTTIPKLELKQTGKKLYYKWITEEPNFEMPVEVICNGETLRLNATNKEQKIKIKPNSLKSIENTPKFFITIDKVTTE